MPTATDTSNFGKTISVFVVAEAGKDLKTKIIGWLNDASYDAGRKELTKRKIRQETFRYFGNGKTTYGSL